MPFTARNWSPTMTDRLVNTISGRLSLREPQRISLEKLARITELVPPSKETDPQAALKLLQSEFPQIVDFERDFVSLCFALATGVGKTQLAKILAEIQFGSSETMTRLDMSEYQQLRSRWCILLSDFLRYPKNWVNRLNRTNPGQPGQCFSQQ